MSINQVIIDGNITKDPEFAYSKSGNAFLRLNIANNKYLINKNTNNFDQITSFYSVVIFGKSAETINSLNLKMGKRIVVFGELSQNVYKDKDTNRDVRVTQIIANKILPIESFNNNNNNGNNYNKNYSQNNNQYQNNSNNGYSNNGYSNNNNDQQFNDEFAFDESDFYENEFDNDPQY